MAQLGVREAVAVAHPVISSSKPRRRDHPRSSRSRQTGPWRAGCVVAGLRGTPAPVSPAKNTMHRPARVVQQNAVQFLFFSPFRPFNARIKKMGCPPCFPVKVLLVCLSVCLSVLPSCHHVVLWHHVRTSCRAMESFPYKHIKSSEMILDNSN